MSLTAAEKEKLKRYSLEGLNKPKLTPKHATKKAIVAIRDPQSKAVKIIRFGAQGYGHNYSKTARAAFLKRHAKNIKRGKSSAAYWAAKFLWAGKGGKTRRP